ncbi:MAG: AEC family transporter [Bifidobacteriaceae bacterium]|nr:AEC family transporter [Bifidobacteriaceae bacterium]
MEALIAIGAKVVLAGALGFVLRRRGVISAQFAEDLGKLLVDVIAPFAILMAAAHPYTPAMARSLGTAVLIAVAYFPLAILTSWLVARALPVDRDTRHAFVNLVVFPNCIFVGLPIITELYGAPGVLCVVVITLVWNLVFFTFGERNLGSGRISPLSLVKSPNIIACVLAVAWFFSRVDLPVALTGALGMMGAAMAPLAMMVVGFGLADSGLADLIKNPAGYIANFLRLLVWPVAILAVARLCGLDPLASDVAAVLFGLPCGTMTVLLAAQHRRAYQFSAQTVVQSNALMFATLPVVFWLIQVWPA